MAGRTDVAFLLKSEILCTMLSPFCDVNRLVAVHLDHGIRNMEKGTGTARYQDGRNSCLLIQIARTGKKRRDRLFVRADNFLHKCIPYHKVRRRRILIQQKQAASRLHAFHDPGCLRCASAGIFR